MKTKQRSNAVITIVGFVLAGVALAGCSMTTSVSKAEVESQMLAQVQAIATEESMPAALACPSDLEGTLGASITCELSFPDGTTRDVIVTVESVTDEGVLFTGELGEDPAQ